jgi:hypothetical protein
VIGRGEAKAPEQRGGEKQNISLIKAESFVTQKYFCTGIEPHIAV